METENVDPTPDTDADSKPQGDGGADTDSDKGPSWEGDFDAERAAKLVENLRTESKTQREELAKLKKALGEKEDAEKSEYQRLQERAEKAEAAASEAQRELWVARALAKHSIPADLADFLTGSDEEAIEAKAAKLAEQIGGKKGSDDLPGKPKRALIPGDSSHEDSAPMDPAKVAAAIRASS